MPAPFIPKPVIGHVVTRCGLRIPYNDCAWLAVLTSSPTVIDLAIPDEIAEDFWLRLSRPKVIGIYGIRNSQTGKRYIGRSADMIARWSSELNQLADGLHHNRELQRDWDTYGSTAFQWRVLELLEDATDLPTREMHWILRQESRRAPLYNRNRSTDSGADWL